MNNRRADTKATNGLSGAADTWPRSAHDFASDIGVSERTIRRAIYRGDLLATKHAGMFRISRHEAEAYLQGKVTFSTEEGKSSSPFNSSAAPDRIAASLPRQLTSMVGREEEVDRLVALLTTTQDDRIRLLTLTGTGGVGKTRLAIGVAERVAGESPLDVLFVSLATVVDPDQVAPAIAGSLGVQVTETDNLNARIAHVLNRTRTLLVLDNFERVVEAASLLVDLIMACPELTVLVTSRMSLHVSGEYEYVVQPLSVTGVTGNATGSPREPSAAVRLFCDRARAVREQFNPDDRDVETISEICRRLDGLPLAIELAASRIRALDPQTLLDHLDKRLPLLTGGGRDLPQRQRDMRQTIDWSYNMLTPGEQRLFRDLGVFVGGCTLEAARAVSRSEIGETADLTSLSVLDGITSLVDQNMLRLEVSFEHAERKPRYSMLETVREYAREALTENGEIGESQARHARYFTEFVERTAPLLQWQHNTVESVMRLDADYDNIVAALNWSSAGDRTCFLRMAAALQAYWCLRGRIAEGKSWLIQAVRVSSDAPLSLRSSVFRSAGWLAWFAAEFENARLLCSEGLELARADEEPFAIAHALSGLGFISQDLDDFENALECHREALAIGVRERSPVWKAWSTRNIGMVAYRTGEFAAAETWLQDALNQFSAINHPYGMTEVMANLSALAIQKGDLRTAAKLIRPQITSTWHESTLCRILEFSARIALAYGQLADATRLYAAAEAHRSRLGGPGHPVDRPVHAQQVSTLKGVFDPVEFDHAWIEGSKLTALEARAKALFVVDRVRFSSVASGATDSGTEALTRREVDVLRLVAANRTNKQIASTLYISIPTVKRHVTNILGKLDAPDRKSAAELARSKGLI